MHFKKNNCEALTGMRGPNFLTKKVRLKYWHVFFTKKLLF